MQTEINAKAHATRKEATPATHIELDCTEPGRWRVVHTDSGTTLESDLPPEYGGQGRSFSATDLLAAALGICIGTNIDTVATRHGVPADALRITVRKTLLEQPKRLAALDVTVRASVAITGDLLARLERAASHCLVHRSLHPDVAVRVTFDAPMTGADA